MNPLLAAASLEHPGDAITAIGLLAAALTTLSFVPQVVRVCRRRSCADVSWAWVISFSTGVALWLAYGLLTGSLPIILANAVTLALTLSILILKVRYRGND